MVKNLPTKQETPVQSLGQEDPLEKETATHSMGIRWTEKPGGLQSMGPQRVGQWACTRRVWWLAQSRLNKCTHKSVKKLDLFSNNSSFPRAYLLCKVRKSSVSVLPSNYCYWKYKWIFTTFPSSCLSLFTFSLLVLWIKAKHLGHEFEQASGVGDGQGSLVCCSPWGLKESNTTEQLHWTKLM